MKLARERAKFRRLTDEDEIVHGGLHVPRDGDGRHLIQFSYFLNDPRE